LLKSAFLFAAGVSVGVWGAHSLEEAHSHNHPSMVVITLDTVVAETRTMEQGRREVILRECGSNRIVGGVPANNMRDALYHGEDGFQSGVGYMNYSMDGFRFGLLERIYVDVNNGDRVTIVIPADPVDRVEKPVIFADRCPGQP